MQSEFHVMKRLNKSEYFLSIILGVVYIGVIFFLTVKVLFTEQEINKFLIIWIFIALVIPVFAGLLVYNFYLKKKSEIQHGIFQITENLKSDLIEHEEVITSHTLNEQIALLTKKYRELKSEISQHDVFRGGYFDTMINGLVVHRKMEILDVNRAICEITGYSEDEMKELSLDRIFIPHESLTGDVSDSMSRLYYRSMCFSKNRQKFPVDIQMSSIQLGQKYIQISIIRDMREKREIEEQLQSERVRRMRAMFDGQELERRRLAKEIHDGLGQSLIAIRLLIEGKIALSSEVDKNALEKIRTLIDRTIDDVRLMSNNLMPSVLHEFGFVTALRQLCDHVRQSTKIKVNFEAECSKFMLSTIQTVYLFRIAQETINNILKHSGASEMSVIVSQSESMLTFVISDNGKGMQPDNMKHDGNGLINIRERVQLLRGEIDIKSEPGNGTEINIIVPNWRLVTNE